MIATLAIASIALLAVSGASAARRRPGPMLSFPAGHKAMIESAYLRGGSDAGKAIELTEKTFTFVGDNATTRKLRPKFDALKTQAPSKELYLKIRWLRREVILSHKLLNFEKLLVNKRGPTGYSHQCDQYLGRHGRPGAGLVVLTNWKTEPQAKVLLEGKLPAGTTLHPDISYDATRVLFSYCDATPTNRGERRYWVYECDINGKWLRQLTGNASDRMETWEGRQTVLIEDWDPCYLPDGGFVFISTRSQNFGRCHGSRYTPSYLLYRGELPPPPGKPGVTRDAGDVKIRQLSFGEANEWDPCVLYDGRIVYTRWDYINRHDTIFQSLWTTRTDGTDVRHYYCNYTRNPYMLAESRPIPGTNKIVATAQAHHSYTAGSIVVIDVDKGEDGEAPLKRITPEAKFPESEGWPSPFVSPWPLSEDLFLAGYSPERQARQGRINSTNAFGIFLVDTLGGRELIYRDPAMSCFAPIPVRPRRVPRMIPSIIDPNDKSKIAKVLCQNVYECRVKIPPNSVGYLRVNEIYCQPANSKTNPSRANNEILKSIIGTVPIESDGSVGFTVPAGVPLQFQLLDKDKIAVFTMRSMTYFHPGENTSCVGCHEPRKSAPPTGRFKALGLFPKLTPTVGPKPELALAFMQTVQPVLDKNCIKCHGLGEKCPGGINLLGKKTRWSLSYDSLTNAKGLVVVAYRNRETAESKIKDYYAHAGRLVKHLMSDKHRKNCKLSKDDFQRIVDWLDLNVQFYGDYAHDKRENLKISRENEKAIRDLAKAELGEKIASQPIEALVNVAFPRQSRILNMPLAASAGGWGQIDKWASKDAAGYKKMAALVAKSIPPFKRRDYNVWARQNTPKYSTTVMK